MLFGNNLQCTSSDLSYGLPLFLLLHLIENNVFFLDTSQLPWITFLFLFIQYFYNLRVGILRTKLRQSMYVDVLSIAMKWVIL